MSSVVTPPKNNEEVNARNSISVKATDLRNFVNNTQDATNQQ